MQQSFIDIHRFEIIIEPAIAKNLSQKISGTQILTSFDDDEIKLPTVGIQINMGAARSNEGTQTTTGAPPYLPRGYDFELTLTVLARRKSGLSSSAVISQIRAALQPVSAPLIDAGTNFTLAFLTPQSTVRQVDTENKVDQAVLTYSGHVSINQ